MNALTADTAAELLNDAEINYLADLYLACFRSDRSSRNYRRFKNAVILASDGATNYRDTCRIIGKLEEKSETAIVASISRALNDLPRPAYKIFNAVYAQPLSQNTRALEMPPYETPSDVVLFLGTAFLYIRLVNYGKFDKRNIL